MSTPGILVRIDRIRREKPASVRDAMLAHLDELYRFAYHMSGHTERAREIVHDSFLWTLERESTVVGNPRAW